MKSARTFPADFPAGLAAHGLRALALAACLALAGTSTLAAADPKASRLYEDALQRFDKKDYKGAIIQLKNALQIDKNAVPVQALLGKSLLGAGEVAASEVALLEALRLGIDRSEIVVPLAQALAAQGKQQEIVGNERFAVAGLPRGTQFPLLLQRAAAWSDLGESANALKDIEQARGIDASVPDSWQAEVPIRIRARQLREAAVAADKAVAMAPKSAEAQYLRGSVAHVQGDISAALAAYGRAIDLDPAHTESLIARSGLMLDLNRLPDAARDVAAAAKAAPKDPRASYLRAQVASRQGDAAAAKAALHEVTALLDAVPMAFMRYRTQLLMLGGLAHHALGEMEKAKPYLEAVQRAQPSSPASKLLAEIYLANKNLPQAIESLEQYLRAQPTDTQALQLLAGAHMSQGRHARAAQIMQDALKQQDAPSLHAALGLSLVGGRRFGDAITELETAWRKDPSLVSAGAALAGLYINAGAGKDAVRVTNKLVEQKPDNPGFLNLAGMAQAIAGDSARARALFEQSAKRDPAFASPRINLARLDLRQGAREQGMRRLADIVQKDPKNVEALLELAHAQESAGQLAEAKRQYTRADDQSSPNDVQPGVELVEFLLRTRQLDEAREAAKRLSGKAPEAVPLLLASARVALASGDATMARSTLARASSLAGFDAGQLVRIGMLQMQAGDAAAAAHSVDKALSTRADYLPALALDADIQIRGGNLAKAEQRARQLLAADPKAGVGYALLGDVAAARKQSAAAIDNYRRAHQIDQSTDSAMRLARALAPTDAAGSQRVLEQWLQSHPRDTVALRALAESHARAGRWPAARSSYEALLAVAPDEAVALNNLAMVQIQQGDFAAASASAERALAKQPAVPAIVGTAGWAAFKAGRADRGLQLLRDARLRDPANLDTRYFLAAVLASAGRAQESRDELLAAIRENRPFEHRQQAEALLATLK